MVIFFPRKDIVGLFVLRVSLFCVPGNGILIAGRAIHKKKPERRIIQNSRLFFMAGTCLVSGFPLGIKNLELYITVFKEPFNRTFSACAHVCLYFFKKALD